MSRQKFLKITPYIEIFLTFCCAVKLQNEICDSILKPSPSVIYQPHEAAGELLKRSFRIAPAEVASLRFNLGSDRKLRKRQNSTSKQM